jgi:predicted deacylase
MQRVLRYWLSAIGVVKDVLMPPSGTIEFEGGMSEVRTNHGGFFLPRVDAGQRVLAGTLLGTIQHVVGGDILEMVEAPYDAMITSVRVNPIVYPHELVIRNIPI